MLECPLINIRLRSLSKRGVCGAPFSTLIIHPYLKFKEMRVPSKPLKSDIFETLLLH